MYQIESSLLAVNLVLVTFFSHRKDTTKVVQV